MAAVALGPAAFFAKFFLQNLSLDEAVWFDHYFILIITPLFYVETLADLEKSNIRPGRTPEDEVRIIADKAPGVSAARRQKSTTEPSVWRASFAATRRVLMAGRLSLGQARGRTATARKASFSTRPPIWRRSAGGALVSSMRSNASSQKNLRTALAMPSLCPGRGLFDRPITLTGKCYSQNDSQLGCQPTLLAKSCESTLGT